MIHSVIEVIDKHEELENIAKVNIRRVETEKDTVEKVAKIKVRRVETEIDTVNISSTFSEKCSLIKDVGHNKATIQVSNLVETLDFKVGQNIAKLIYSDLKPLPFSQPLRVLLVPHSHCDPGWGQTYMSYYMSRVRHLLTNLYQFTMSHGDFKYIYAEVSFFKLWWTDQNDEVRMNMRKLAREGRFEFVQGGWVQADEANTHYFALFNDMLDGHDWLKQNLPEAIPKSGWAIDPFGLSPMKAYINKLFGLTGMHVERVHYRVKTHLASARKIEFKWRQSWDVTGETDILTNVGQFFGYETDNTCGPDKDVCAKFTFNRRTGLEANVKESNVKELSELILDQWRKKAALHQTGTIFVEIGEDFAYVKQEALSDIYDKYTPLMEYINKEPSLNTEVTWGVLSEYFEHVRAHGLEKLPSLSGDFFTYADREADYWSGYYTSRPFYKNLDRLLESALRRTEILFSFTRIMPRKEDLIAARHALSLFQHHDGITGTSVRTVVNDYGAILYDAYKTCNELTTLAIRKLLSNQDSLFTPVVVREVFNDYDKYKVLDGHRQLILVNTLPRDIQTLQVIAVMAGLKMGVVGKDWESISQQTEPRIEYGKINHDSHYIIFQTFSRSVSLENYHMNSAAQLNKATIALYNAASEDFENFSKSFETKIFETNSCTDIVLGLEEIMSITIDCQSGRLKGMRKGRISMNVDQEVLLYTGHGGAYLFRPSSQPVLHFSSSSRPRVIVVKGPLRHKAVVYVGDLLVLSYTVNLVTDTEYAELEILTNLQEDGDLALRFKTDIVNQDSLFTDNNGHTIQQHRYKEKLHTQGNFFPMPSTAFIQDSTRRFSLLSSEPHGVASLSNGYLEVVLDRRYTSTNDNRGLPEGIKDNLPTPARLRLLLEYQPVSPPLEGYRVEYPSLLSYQVLQTLQHPVFVGHREVEEDSGEKGEEESGEKSEDEKELPRLNFRQLMREFPCDEELVNLRHVEENTSLLIRRRLGFTCNIDFSHMCTSLSYSDLSKVFIEKVTSKQHPFSPFHENEFSANSSESKRPMQFSSDYVIFSN